MLLAGDLVEKENLLKETWAATFGIGCERASVRRINPATPNQAVGTAIELGTRNRLPRMYLDTHLNHHLSSCIVLSSPI